MFEALRDRRFLLLFTALTLSMLGDSALLVVLGIAAKDLTGSFTAAGLTYVGIVAPSLLAPFGGVVVDRTRRQTFLVWACLITGAAVLSLLFVRSPGDVWLIYAVSVAYGLSYFLINAASYSLVKIMLPDEDLGSANGLLQTSRQALRLVAPLLGAGIYAWGGLGAVAVFDAVTFLVAALVVLSLRVPEQRPRMRHVPDLREFTAGGTHLWRERVLRRVTAVVSGSLLFIGIGTTTIYAVVEQGLHRPTSFVGVLTAFQGIGAVAGGLTATALMRRLGEPRTVALGLILFAVGQAGLAVPDVVLAAACMIVGYYGLTAMFVAAATVVQRRTGAAEMGRTSTAVAVANGLPQAISIGVGAVLINYVDYRILQVVLGAAVTVLAGWLLLNPEPPPSRAAPASVAGDRDATSRP